MEKPLTWKVKTIVSPHTKAFLLPISDRIYPYFKREEEGLTTIKFVLLNGCEEPMYFEHELDSNPKGQPKITFWDWKDDDHSEVEFTNKNISEWIDKVHEKEERKQPKVLVWPLATNFFAVFLHPDEKPKGKA